MRRLGHNIGRAKNKDEALSLTKAVLQAGHLEGLAEGSPLFEGSEYIIVTFNYDGSALMERLTALKKPMEVDQHVDVDFYEDVRDMGPLAGFSNPEPLIVPQGKFGRDHEGKDVDNKPPVPVLGYERTFRHALLHTGWRCGEGETR